MADTPATPLAAATRYVVLASTDGHTWKIDGPYQRARNAEHAVRQAVQLRQESDVDSSQVSFLAVPERSWRPLTATVETKTTVKIA